MADSDKTEENGFGLLDFIRMGAFICGWLNDLGVLYYLMAFAPFAVFGHFLTRNLSSDASVKLIALILNSHFIGLLGWIAGCAAIVICTFMVRSQKNKNKAEIKELEETNRKYVGILKTSGLLDSEGQFEMKIEDKD